MAMGAMLLIVGFFFSVGYKYLYLGRLPGDIAYQRGGFSFYFPLVSSIVLSLVLTLVLNLVFRFWRR